MFCSVVIPTIGRPTLSRTVESVFNQEASSGEFEVIIVNDSGEPLADAEWQSSSLVKIIHTYRRERNFARNSGAAIAKGNYLYFLDDDDWLLPGALKEFYELSRIEPEAAWLYGGIRVVNQAGDTIAEVNSGFKGNCLAQVIGGAWIPIQSSLIKTTAFFNAGGFNPLILGTEDQDLCRRIALYGDFANTSSAVACLLRGITWDTSTDYLRAPKDTVYSRDDVLSEPDALKKLLASAAKDANPDYWFGRLVRVYLSTVKFNLVNKRVFSAASRFLWCLIVILKSGRYLFSSNYWRAIKAHHVENTLHFIMEASQNEKLE